MRLLAACLSPAFLASAFLAPTLAAPALFAPAALAQAPGAAPMASPCDGTMVVTRVSAIKPGQMSLFLQAAAAQQAWYRTNGVTTNRIVVGKVLNKDGTWSDTEAVTYHVNTPGPDAKLPRGDDGYKAFVKMFRDSSDIKYEYLTCTPKMM